MSVYSESFFTNQAGGFTASAAASTLSRETKSAVGPFDVFLSHSVRDARVILGVRKWLLSKGLSVYVDWIDDTRLDRENVSPATAARLRLQMSQSHTLIYATSQNARTSRWMPWELGYFDGSSGKDKVSILPIDDSTDHGYAGEEYVGLYRRIEQQQTFDGKRDAFVISPSGDARPLRTYARSRFR